MAAIADSNSAIPSRGLIQRKMGLSRARNPVKESHALLVLDVQERRAKAIESVLGNPSKPT